MQTFEIVIYNEQVRKLVKQGESHRRYSDDWGDTHYIEFKADSEGQAVAKCRQKYPEEDGFVIESISMV
jgi:hypothetical protein